MPNEFRICSNGVTEDKNKIWKTNPFNNLMEVLQTSSKYINKSSYLSNSVISQNLPPEIGLTVS